VARAVAISRHAVGGAVLQHVALAVAFRPCLCVFSGVCEANIVGMPGLFPCNTLCISLVIVVAMDAGQTGDADRALVVHPAADGVRKLDMHGSFIYKTACSRCVAAHLWWAKDCELDVSPRLQLSPGSTTTGQLDRLLRAATPSEEFR
jgi:hypothetical protein